MKGLSKEFTIGLVVLMCIAIMVIGTNYLKGINLFDRPLTFYSIYPDVDGLGESNPVLLNGYKVGLISNIKMHPDGTGNLLVQVSINDKNLKVPADTKLKIVTSDFFGSKAVKIELGDSSVFAQSKDTLTGELELDITKTLKQEFEPLKEKAQKLIAGVDEAITNLNEVFDNSAMKELPKTFTSLQNTMENLENLSGKLNGLVGSNAGQISSIISNVNSISENLKANNETLSRAISNIGSLSDTLARVQLASTIRKVDKAMEDFATITAKINSGEGTLGQLLNTDTLHAELVTASHDLDLLLNEMRVHPKRFLSFSVFGKKDSGDFSKKELEQMREEIDRAIKEKEAKSPGPGGQ